MENASRLRIFSRIFMVIIGLVLVLALFSFLGRFMYFLEVVEEQEIGVRLSNGKIKAGEDGIVGPGVYSDFGIQVNIQRISLQAVPFEVTDPEIITADKQRIGLVVNGDIFRPQDKDRIRTLWSQYRGLYTDDQQILNRITSFARQSMKVCVGDRTFDDNIIGTARDALRACVDTELNELAGELGITVENVSVPEVILSPEVQTALDAIVQSRLATEKAAQDQLLREAEAAAEQARQQGEIRVEQSRLQEQTRQQTALAQLEQERLAAQLVVIEAERNNSLAQIETDRAILEAEKANELLDAQLSLEINQIAAETALIQAQIDLSQQLVLAELYADNPEFVQLQIVQANANALAPTDKIFFLPEGTIPNLVIPGPGVVPTVDSTSSTVPAETTTP